MLTGFAYSKVRMKILNAGSTTIVSEGICDVSGGPPSETGTGGPVASGGVTRPQVTLGAPIPATENAVAKLAAQSKVALDHLQHLASGQIAVFLKPRRVVQPLPMTGHFADMISDLIVGYTLGGVPSSVKANIDDALEALLGGFTFPVPCPLGGTVTVTVTFKVIEVPNGTIQRRPGSNGSRAETTTAARVYPGEGRADLNLTLEVETGVFGRSHAARAALLYHELLHAQARIEEFKHGQKYLCRGTLPPEAPRAAEEEHIRSLQWAFQNWLEDNEIW